MTITNINHRHIGCDLNIFPSFRQCDETEELNKLFARHYKCIVLNFYYVTNAHTMVH